MCESERLLRRDETTGHSQEGPMRLRAKALPGLDCSSILVTVDATDKLRFGTLIGIGDASSVLGRTDRSVCDVVWADAIMPRRRSRSDRNERISSCCSRDNCRHSYGV